MLAEEIETRIDTLEEEYAEAINEYAALRYAKKKADKARKRMLRIEEQLHRWEARAAALAL